MNLSLKLSQLMNIINKSIVFWQAWEFDPRDDFLRRIDVEEENAQILLLELNFSKQHNYYTSPPAAIRNRGDKKSSTQQLRKIYKNIRNT